MAGDEARSQDGTPPRAVVTGAASGIGLTLCRELLERGWRVEGLDLTASPLGEYHPGRFRALECDVASSARIGAAFDALAEDGPVDALICSAGVAKGGPLLDTREEDFDLVFDVNVKGAWLCARAAAPLLRQSRRPPARIVFVASGAALRPKIGAGVYSASKIALINLAKVLAVELATEGILVNAVAPATVDTPFIERLKQTQKGFRITGDSPLGRIAQPEDVTGVIRFLLGSDSSYMTGAVLPVDGGTTAAFVPPARPEGSTA